MLSDFMRCFVRARPRPEEEGETIRKLFRKQIVATRVIDSIGWIDCGGLLALDLELGTVSRVVEV